MVIGAGAVGAACAYFMARAGLAVHVVERGAIASGTSSACEGNLLVSDKEAGPELDLALYSRSVWNDDLAEHGPRWEFEAKGGLVVVASEQGAQTLSALASRQRAAGIEVREVAGADLQRYEPHLSPALAAGAFYPQDAQVQPMLLVAHLLWMARELGATVETQTPVTGLLRDGDRVTGVKTSIGPVAAACGRERRGSLGTERRPAGRGRAPRAAPARVRARHRAAVPDRAAQGLRGRVRRRSAELRRGSADLARRREHPQRHRLDRLVPGAGRFRPQRVATRADLARPAARSRCSPCCAASRPCAATSGSGRIARTISRSSARIAGLPDLWHAGGHEGAGIGLSVGTAKLLTQALSGSAHRSGPVALRTRAVREPPARGVPWLSDYGRRPLGPPITLTFDGRPVAAVVGDSVGAALTRAGVRSWRTTRHEGRPRGLFCGIGICYDCLLTVDGAANQRACLVPAVDGMELRSE